ncbi:MAG: hypothetical protein WCF90_03620 [Methanomicrobiales archaeon]
MQERGHSIVAFTGFSPDLVLKSTRPEWKRLVAVTDLLIAGPYITSLKCYKPWIDSSNQRIIPLTDTITLPASSPHASGHAAKFKGRPLRRVAKGLTHRCRGDNGTPVFSRVRKQFRHREALIQCLGGLSHTVKTDITITGDHGQHTVDIAAKQSGRYGVGFGKN